MKDNNITNNNKEVICPKCVGSINPKRFCGLYFNKDLCGHCISCTHFYPKLKNVKNWIRYYCGKVQNYVGWAKYKLTDWWGWLYYEHLKHNHIPSDIKKGDVIVWRDKKGYLHKDVVLHIWVEYDWRNSRFFIMTSLSNSGLSPLNSLLENAKIITINGKCPRGYNNNIHKMEGKDNYESFWWQQHRYAYENDIKPYLGKKNKLVEKELEEYQNWIKENYEDE